MEHALARFHVLVSCVLTCTHTHRIAEPMPSKCRPSRSTFIPLAKYASHSLAVEFHSVGIFAPEQATDTATINSRAAVLAIASYGYERGAA